MRLFVFFLVFSHLSIAQQNDIYSLDGVDAFPMISKSQESLRTKLEKKEFLFRQFRFHLINSLEKKYLTELIQKEKVFIQFEVNAKKEVRITKTSVHSEELEVALNTIFSKLKLFQPAFKNNQAVNVSFVLQLKFKKQKPKQNRKPWNYY